MKISLQPSLQQFVDEQIQAGRFSSPEEIIAAALSQFQLDQTAEKLSEEDLAELRSKINVGLDEANRGESERWDPDEIWAEVERQADSRKSSR
jgi:antitoxin ParD1/3/4